MKNNKGFTLIEIGIVLFAVGILDAINAIALSCNIPRDSVLDSTGWTPILGGAWPIPTIDVLTKGKDVIDPQYHYCYDQSGIKPISYPPFPSATIALSSRTIAASWQAPVVTWYFPPNDSYY